MPVANAFALVVEGSVARRRPRCAVLSDEELGAAFAHELGHLSERRWVLAARVAATTVVGIWVVSPAAVRPILASAGPTFGLLIIVGVVAISWLMLSFYTRIYQRMEIPPTSWASIRAGSRRLCACAREDLRGQSRSGRGRRTPPPLPGPLRPHDRRRARFRAIPVPGRRRDFQSFSGCPTLFLGAAAGAVVLDGLALAIASL